MSFKNFILLLGAMLFPGTIELPARQLAPSFSGLVRSEVSGLRLVKFNGALSDQEGKPLTGTVGITFAIYSDQQGGAPLWMETQNVQLNSQGTYSVLLGATTGQGIPPETFSSDAPRWLGVRVLAQESEEQPRSLFVSVPYAVKAADADTLGGKPLSAFVLSESSAKDYSSESKSEPGKSSPSGLTDSGTVAAANGNAGFLSKFVTSTDLGDSVVFETNGKIGVGTTAPSYLTQFHSAGSHSLLQLTNSTTGSGAADGAYFGVLNGETVFRIYNLEDANIEFFTNNQRRMTVGSNGNIGIGTQTPNYLTQLHSNGSHSLLQLTNATTGSTPSDGVYFGVLSGDAAFRIMNQENAPIELFTNGAPRMAITAAGNVGIGTPAPTSKLDVSGTVNTTSLSLPNTASGSSGVLTFGGARFIHNFGGNNTFVGTNAGNFTMTGVGNTAGGGYTLSLNTTGSGNTAIGGTALENNTSGNYNTANGWGALHVNSTGFNNTATGAYSLQFNTAGSGNTATGSYSLFNNTTGNSNTANGTVALTSNTTGHNNTATGADALRYNTSGFNNTATGAAVLGANTTGYLNTAMGSAALISNTTGFNNTGIGVNALDSNTTGFNNTAVGLWAGVTAVSSNANKTGSSNTFIGYQAGPGTSTQLTNATAIGANALVSANNALVLGDSSVSVGIGTQAPFDKLDVAGDIRVGTGTTGCVKDRDGTIITGTCSSDVRLKRNIAPFEPLLERLVRIQPVYFDWRSDEYPDMNFGSLRSFGLIAQEVEKVLPEMVTEDERGYKAVKYSQLPLLLLEAVRELRAENDGLREEMKAQIRYFQSQLEGMKAHMVEGVPNGAK